jgi:hypothetical protein
VQNVTQRNESPNTNCSNHDDDDNNTNNDSWDNFWNSACLDSNKSNNDETTTETIDNVNRKNQMGPVIVDAETALDVILRARLIVGFHPDQATDACIDLAKVLNIPFAVVPCCVFPSEFPHRTIICSEDFDSNDIHGREIMNLYCRPVGKECDNPDDLYTEENDSNTTTTTIATYVSRPVKKYNDLLLYLHQIHPDLNTRVLPFQGTTTARKIVLFTLPP